MLIKIGEKIKFLRHENNITQDTLAESLGVTAQAVSRWESESCYPDIETLPAIASFFGITIDELLGYDVSEAKQNECIARLNKLVAEGDSSALEEAGKAHILYPKNKVIAIIYASQLMIHSAENDESLDEGISLCSRVLDESDIKEEDYLTMLGMKIVMIMFLLKKDRKKEAFDFAYILPPVAASWDYILPLTMEADTCREFILSSIPMIMTMLCSIYLQKFIRGEEKIRGIYEYDAVDCRRDLRLWDAVYADLLNSDGISYKYTSWNYLFLHQRLAKLCSDNGEIEEALFHLTELQKCIEFSEYNAVNIPQRSAVTEKDPNIRKQDYTGKNNAYVLLKGYMENGYFSNLVNEELYKQFEKIILEKALQ